MKEKQYRPNEVIFSVIELTEEIWDGGNKIAEICICPRDFFEKYETNAVNNIGLNDVGKLLVNNGFEEFVECIFLYKYNKLKTKEEVKDKLISLGLHHSQALQDLIEKRYFDDKSVDKEEENEIEEFWNQFTVEERSTYEKLVGTFALWWKKKEELCGNYQFDYCPTEEEQKEILSSISSDEMIERWEMEISTTDIYSYEGQLYIVIDDTYDCDFYRLPVKLAKKLIEVLSKYSVDNLPPL